MPAGRALRRRAGRARARRRPRRARSCATPGRRSGRARRRRRSSGPRAHEVVALRRRGRTSARATPGRNGGPGSAIALQREQRRARRRGGSRRATRPGCPEARRRASAPRTPNASGLPGRIATPQKTSSTPSRACDRRTRSWGPTETPPDVTSTSASSARVERGRALLVVLDRRQPLDARPHRLERGREHDAVRLVDLPGSSGSPGGRSSVPVRRSPRVGRRAQPTARDPAGRERREAGRREQRSRPRAARRRRATSPPCSRMLSPEATASAISTGRPDDDALDRHDRVGSLRHDPSGRDRRSPRPRRARASRAARRRRVPTIAQRAGRVGGADGVAVHRRAREGREVDRRVDRARRGRGRRALERDLFRRQRRGAREHRSSASSTDSSRPRPAR